MGNGSGGEKGKKKLAQKKATEMLQISPEKRNRINQPPRVGKKEFQSERKEIRRTEGK